MDMVAIVTIMIPVEVVVVAVVVFFRILSRPIPLEGVVGEDGSVEAGTGDDLVAVDAIMGAEVLDGVDIRRITAVAFRVDTLPALQGSDETVTNGEV